MVHEQVDLKELYARAVDEFGARVAQVKSDQWHDPTPCTDWDVHALVNHVVNEARWVSPLLAGKTLEEVGDSLDGDLLGDDPNGAWERARDEQLKAVAGADSLQRPVHVSWGQIPAGEYMDQVLMDHLIHGWDLARAVGADERLDPELVEHCYAKAKPQEEMIRGSGVYGDSVSVADDADTQTKLLALLGRRAQE